MDYTKYIFVDYENVQDMDINIIEKNIKIQILVGENQKKIPVDLIKKAQPLGESIEWMQIKTNGRKNALDFFIVYFLSFYISSNNDKEFIIYSKDTGYDPLIDYLKLKNIKVKRIVSFKQIQNNEINKTKSKRIINFNNEISKIQENLNKGNSNARPKSKKGLVSHIKILLKKTDQDIEEIIEEMFISKIIYEENQRIKYNF